MEEFASDGGELEPDSSENENDEPSEAGFLKVGATFISFDNFDKMLSQHQDKCFCLYYKRDSRTIAQARTKKITRYIAPELKYYYLNYSCIHGGKRFKSKSVGKRDSS